MARFGAGFALSKQTMVRISIKDDSRVATLKVEGKLVGLFAEELRNTWRDLWTSAWGKPLRLDIRSVSFVDANGIQILREIVRVTGAEILTDSPLTHYFATQAQSDLALETTEESSYGKPM